MYSTTLAIISIHKQQSETIAYATCTEYTLSGIPHEDS